MNQGVQERRHCVDNANTLSVARQCELPSIHRSGLYYKPASDDQHDLELMRLIDEQHMKRGVPRMTEWLRQDMGHMVNPKRIERLYRTMGIQAIGPKPNTSKPGKGHKVYPYLLKNLKVIRPNQVWAMDITYVPVQGGFSSWWPSLISIAVMW